jgi:hypothetical protein
MLLIRRKTQPAVPLPSGSKLVTIPAKCLAMKRPRTASPLFDFLGAASMRASLRDLSGRLRLAAVALALSACSTNPPPVETTPAPAMAPEIPSTIRPEEIVGRWGYGAYHNEADRARTEAAARGQCGQPVLINRGPNGGVMMYLADSAQLQELYLKGGPGGRNYVGPPGPAGGPQDREVVAFDGRAIVLRWINPEVQTRYGTGVYVRCAPEGTRRPPR